MQVALMIITWVASHTASCILVNGLPPSYVDMNHPFVIIYLFIYFISEKPLGAIHLWELFSFFCPVGTLVVSVLFLNGVSASTLHS